MPEALHADHATASPAFAFTPRRNSLSQFARERVGLSHFPPHSDTRRSHLLPGECRHIGAARAPIAPIQPSVPLAFMCPLLAPDSQPRASPASVHDDDFLSDGRSSFAWQARHPACAHATLPAPLI
jgi:hypothetical protein